MVRWRQIWIAFKLWYCGLLLEQRRGKLKRLYLLNEPNDSRKMQRARAAFQRACDQWISLEEEYDIEKR